MFLIWLNMLMSRYNVFEKGEIDGRIRIFKAGFKCILAASILVMLIVSTQKKELINAFSLWFISILCIGVSASRCLCLGLLLMSII